MTHQAISLPPHSSGWHPRAWSTRAKVLALLAIVMAAWGWFDVRVRGRIDPNDLGLHKTDFTVYTTAAAAFFDGRKPYEVTNPRGWGYLYPPPFALLVAPLAALPPTSQVLVWFALSVLMTWGCYRECLRLARLVLPDSPERPMFGPIPDWIGGAAITAALFPALNCLQRGQVGVLKLYLLLLGFRLCLASRSAARSFLAGGVLALPIVLKVTPLVPVGFLLFEQLAAGWFAAARSRALARAGACVGGVTFGLVLCLLLLPAGVIGWRANLDHLDTWWHEVAIHAENSTSDRFAGDSASPRNQSFINAVCRLGNWASYCFAGGPNDWDPTPLRLKGVHFLMEGPLVDGTLLAARAAAGCLLLAVAWRTAHRQDPLELAAAFGLAIVATLILSPIARAHYFVLLYPAVMFTSAWHWRQRRPRWALASAIALAALVVIHYAALNVAGRIGLLGLGTTAWYVVSCLAILRYSGNRAVQAESPLGVRWDPSTNLPALHAGQAHDARHDAAAHSAS